MAFSAGPNFRTGRGAALVAALLLMLGVGPVGDAAWAAQVTQIRLGPAQMGNTQDVRIDVNKSVIVDLPVDAYEVIVSQPTVAGAVMRTRNRAIIQGVASGSTNIFFLDAAGNAISVLDVSVGGSSSAEQVMIKVTVAEVQRETLKELGVNLSGSLTVGAVNLGFNNAMASSLDNVGTNGYSGGVTLPGLEIDAALRALNRRNSIRMLAEPTLTAVSGASAEFLAGGEIPFPVTTGDNGTTIEWKEFGVELDFTPTVKANGMISMVVDTAVSELRNDGGLNKRRVASTVELAAGQTLAIGGLLQETTRQQIAGLPGLGDIPILGALFRSREYLSNETELLVLVTPWYAHAGAAPVTPTDRFAVANDAEAIFLGQMQKTYGAGPLPLSDGEYRGSIGFILE